VNLSSFFNRASFSDQLGKAFSPPQRTHLSRSWAKRLFITVFFFLFACQVISFKGLALFRREWLAVPRSMQDIQLFFDNPA